MGLVKNVTKCSSQGENVRIGGSLSGRDPLDSVTLTSADGSFAAGKNQAQVSWSACLLPVGGCIHLLSPLSAAAMLVGLGRRRRRDFYALAANSYFEPSELLRPSIAERARTRVARSRPPPHSAATEIVLGSHPPSLSSSLHLFSPIKRVMSTTA